MKTVKVTYNEVSMIGRKVVKCVGGCDRRLNRQKKFYQTLSPFNKRKDGKLKDSSDIRKELMDKIRVWTDELETCSHCQS